MASQAEGSNRSNQVFVDTPFASYQGHTSDLLDVSWSKVIELIQSNNFENVRQLYSSGKQYSEIALINTSTSTSFRTTSFLLHPWTKQFDCGIYLVENAYVVFNT